MYAYNAAIWCDDCAAKVQAELDAKGIEDSGDSDHYPQWCSDDSEFDSPEHCDECHVFLESRLTGDGYTYVEESVREAIVTGRLDSVAITEWLPHYAGTDDDLQVLADNMRTFAPAFATYRARVAKLEAALRDVVDSVDQWSRAQGATSDSGLVVSCDWNAIETARAALKGEGC